MNNNNIIEIVLVLSKRDITTGTENSFISYCTILTASRSVSSVCLGIKCTNCPLSSTNRLERVYEK